jgi:putative inorganic carbon (hco3(-)) transporter
MAHEMAFDDVANAPLTSEERAPTRREERSVPFWGLMMFTFVLLVAPQTFVPGLGALMPAKLSMAVAMGAYLVSGRQFPVTRTVQYGLGLLGCAIISIPLGFWPGGSVDVFFDLLGKSLVVFILIASVVDTTRRLKILVGSMVGFGTVAAVYAVIQYRTGMLDPTGQRIAGFQSPLATNPNDLALTLNILLALGIGLLPVTRRRSRRILLMVAMAFLVAGIVASFSRGGFITLGVLGVAWAVQAVRTRGVQAIGVLLLVAVVLGLAAPAEYVNRLATIFDSEADETGSSSERWEVMGTALGYIAERPLFGMGLGNSRHVSVVRGGPDREAHNAYLKAGAEMGVIGLTVYVLFVASAYTAARSVRRRALRRPYGAELASLAGGVQLAVLTFAVGALFAPVPYHFYFYYPAGLAVALTTMMARLDADAASEEATPADAAPVDEA